MRIALHPILCPHLDPIERCWGMMHHHVTHNRDYKTFREFRSAILTFLRRTIPKKWHLFRDRITDNFRVISPGGFRVIIKGRCANRCGSAAWTSLDPSRELRTALDACKRLIVHVVAENDRGYLAQFHGLEASRANWAWRRATAPL